MNHVISLRIRVISCLAPDLLSEMYVLLVPCLILAESITVEVLKTRRKVLVLALHDVLCSTGTVTKNDKKANVRRACTRKEVVCSSEMKLFRCKT